MKLCLIEAQEYGQFSTLSNALILLRMCSEILVGFHLKSELKHILSWGYCNTRDK